MKIGERYLHTTFIYDFVPIFPITFFVNTTKESLWRICFFIKVMRLAIGLKIFKISNIVYHL